MSSYTARQQAASPSYNQGGSDFSRCPLEQASQGFQEIARTEIDVPVTVKKPVTTYVDEEVCKTISIPTYRKDFNLFRVAPVVIDQRPTEVHNDGYYKGTPHTLETPCERCQAAEGGYVRASDNPYLENEYKYQYEYPGFNNRQ